jgi:hypothetical protein
MTVLIGTWEFEGPFARANELRNEAGLYAILSNGDKEVELVELNESAQVRASVEQLFDVTPGSENFSTAVYYCTDLTTSLRQGLIEEVLKEFDVPDDFEPEQPSRTLNPPPQAFLQALNL